MIFGDRLSAAASAEPAGWLPGALGSERWTVGGLVPCDDEGYLLVDAASPDIDDWWEAQREIVGALAEVLARFTETPNDAWFAVWDGHGFDRRDTRVVRCGDVAPTAEQPAALERLRAEAREQDARFVAETARALQAVPRFELPGRARSSVPSGHALVVSSVSRLAPRSSSCGVSIANPNPGQAGDFDRASHRRGTATDTRPQDL